MDPRCIAFGTTCPSYFEEPRQLNGSCGAGLRDGRYAGAAFAEGEVKVGQIALTVGRTYDTGPIATFLIASVAAAVYRALL